MVFVFTKELWIYFASTFIIFACIWIYIEYKYFKLDPVGLIFDLVALFLEDSPSQKNVQRSFRILWVFFSLIMITAFQAELVSILTEPIFTSQIKSVEEGLKQGFTFGFFPVVYKTLYEDNTTISKKILKKRIPCDNTMTCIHRLIKDRNVIIAKAERGTTYGLQTLYKNSGGSKTVYKLDNSVFIFGVHMLVNKGYPVYDSINDIFGILIQSGIAYKLENDYKLSHVDDIYDSDLVILSLYHLAIPFMILIGGYISAFLVFIYEIKMV